MQVQSWHDYASDEKAVRPVKTGTRVKFVHVIKQQHFVRTMFVMRKKELKEAGNNKIWEIFFDPKSNFSRYFFLICFRCKCLELHWSKILFLAWKKGWNECLIFILSKCKLLYTFKITTTFRSWSFLIFRYV